MNTNANPCRKKPYAVEPRHAFTHLSLKKHGRERSKPGQSFTAFQQMPPLPAGTWDFHGIPFKIQPGRGGSGRMMRHERLPYWVEFARSQGGSDAPVIVVQSQCWRASQRKSPEIAPLDGCYHALSFGYKKPGDKEPQGGAMLKEALRDAVRTLRETSGGLPMLPDTWRVLRKRCREWIDPEKPPEERKQILGREEFDNLCADLKIQDPDTALHYLHQSGVVFYDPEHLGERIILDQNWALRPIYDVFHRDSTYNRIIDGGRIASSKKDTEG